MDYKYNAFSNFFYLIERINLDKRVLEKY